MELNRVMDMEDHQNDTDIGGVQQPRLLTSCQEEELRQEKSEIAAAQSEQLRQAGQENLRARSEAAELARGHYCGASRSVC